MERVFEEIKQNLAKKGFKSSIVSTQRLADLKRSWERTIKRGKSGVREYSITLYLRASVVKNFRLPLNIIQDEYNTANEYGQKHKKHNQKSPIQVFPFILDSGFQRLKNIPAYP